MCSSDELIKVMVYLTAHFPRFELKEATIKAYHDVLQDISADLLQAAAREHAANGKYFPFASELRRLAFDMRAKAQGIPSAAEAWGEVMGEMRRVGSWGTPEFSTPLIARAVDGLGGWRMLCASDNNVADRAHFLKIYGEFLGRQEQDAAMLPEIRELVQRLSAEMDRPRLEEGK